MSATRNELLNHRPIRTVETSGLEVCIKPMTGRDTVRLHQWQEANPEANGLDTMGQVLARCICDEQGARQFTDEDASALADLPINDIKALYKVCDEMNGLTETDLEDAEGN